jgi:hypothetical protein
MLLRAGLRHIVCEHRPRVERRRNGEPHPLADRFGETGDNRTRKGGGRIVPAAARPGARYSPAFTASNIEIYFSL